MRQTWSNSLDLATFHALDPAVDVVPDLSKWHHGNALLTRARHTLKLNVSL